MLVYAIAIFFCFSKIVKACNDQMQLLDSHVHKNNPNSKERRDQKFWEQISAILNKEGPAIKNPELWKKVYFCLVHPSFYIIF